jgi:hypothetical protein
MIGDETLHLLVKVAGMVFVQNSRGTFEQLVSHIARHLAPTRDDCGPQPTHKVLFAFEVDEQLLFVVVHPTPPCVSPVLQELRIECERGQELRISA